MCGRFRVSIDFERSELLREVFAQVIERVRQHEGDGQQRIVFDGDAVPSNLLPVLARNRAGDPRGFAMTWGVPKWDGSGLIINARSETALQSRFFSESAQNRRCLLPAAWYYEWRDDGGSKTRFAFRRTDGEPFLLGGLYRVADDPADARFTILTREADERFASIHHRMPLLIPQERALEWLAPEVPFDAARELAVADVEWREGGFAA